jgi:hypothetical protein
MITGFFCTAIVTACAGLPNQTLVQATHILPQCGTVWQVTRRGQQVGAYVDDTAGAAETKDIQCVQSAGLPIYSGEWGHDTGMPGGMVEWYPVLDHRSRVGTPPGPGQRGYILQAFSWGDNVVDGETMGRCASSDTQTSCSARYSRPGFTQLRQMWCAARARKPREVLWYYAGGEPEAQVFRVMRRPCGAGPLRSRRSTGLAHPLPPSLPGLTGPPGAAWLWTLVLMTVPALAASSGYGTGMNTRPRREPWAVRAAVMSHAPMRKA